MKQAWVLQWRGLPARERARGILLGAFLVVFFGYQAFYRPQMLKLAKAKAEERGLREQTRSMKNSLPDFEAQRLEFRSHAEEIETLRGRLQGMESQLSTVEGLGALLGQLSERGEGLQITFDSIKQRIKEDPDRPEAAIDVGFVSTYEDTVNYVRRIERLSPFLQIMRIDMAESKESPRLLADVKMTIKTPLRLSPGGPGGFENIGEAASAGKTLLSRSPFVSKLQSSSNAKQKKTNIKVSGITWHGEASTAIVNDTVVRVNDSVEVFVVKQILPNCVVFSDGVENFAVELQS